MRKGHLRFELSGQRLHGRFTLARLKQRDPKKQKGWFLIKDHDEAARAGVDALRLEQEVPFPATPTAPAGPKARGKKATKKAGPPAEGGPRVATGEAGAAALRDRRRAGGRRRVGFGDQVRWLSPDRVR